MDVARFIVEELDVIDLMNAERKKVGLDPLKVHTALVRSADAHCIDMVANGTFSHYGSDGSTWADRAARAGYPNASLYTIGEVIAEGQTAADLVVRDWMADAPHRNAILNPQAKHAGAACRATKANVLYWTTDFGWGAPDPGPAPVPPTPRPAPEPRKPGWLEWILRFLRVQ